MEQTVSTAETLALSEAVVSERGLFTTVSVSWLLGEMAVAGDLARLLSFSMIFVMSLIGL